MARYEANPYGFPDPYTDDQGPGDGYYEEVFDRIHEHHQAEERAAELFREPGPAHQVPDTTEGAWRALAADAWASGGGCVHGVLPGQWCMECGWWI